MIWVFVSPQNPITQYDGIWRCLGHEDETLLNEINGFVTETPQILLAVFAKWRYSEKAHSVASPPQTLNLLVLWSWASPSLELQEVSVAYSYPIFGILL